MWFSLIRMPCHSARRWLPPPPTRTAYFCAWRRPGKVLRVSSTAQPRGFGDAPAIARTNARVMLAVPDSSCRKFSAGRSAVSNARASPASSQTTESACMSAPSA